MHDWAVVHMPNAMDRDDTTTSDLQALDLLGRSLSRLDRQELARRSCQAAIGSMETKILEEEAERMMRRAAGDHRARLAPPGQQSLSDQVDHRPTNCADGDPEPLR